MADEEKACCLSALAPELIDNILFYLDSVRALGNFITTCRCIYRRFEGRQGPIVFRVLQNELGPVLADARFLSQFPYADPGGSPDSWVVYWDGLHAMAAVYRDMLGSGGDVCVPSFTELTQQCLTLHQMNLLSNTYVAARLRWLGGEGPATAPPSRAERLRVLRAFYRRQIICNAWAPTKREARWMDQDVAAVSNSSDHHGVRLGLLAALEPWELQQVDHADHFVALLCTSLSLAGDEVAQPISEAEFGDMFSHIDHLAQYMREHPSIADAALRTQVSLLRLGSREVLDAAPMCSQFIERYSLLCLQFAWQTHRLHRFPDPARDQREQQQQQQQEHGGRGMVHFVGDAVDLPPFGWVDALDGRYVNWFGNALADVPRTPVPDEDETYAARYSSLQLWRGAGFALWDQRRVKAMKELEQLRTLRTGWVIYW